jgi:hypothetical protein
VTVTPGTLARATKERNALHDFIIVSDGLVKDYSRLTSSVKIKKNDLVLVVAVVHPMPLRATTAFYMIHPSHVGWAGFIYFEEITC